MSGPKVRTNHKTVLPRANTNRPIGCSALVESLNPDHLLLAIAFCNRATKRVAHRKMMKQAKSWAKTPAGKLAIAKEEGKS